MYFFFACRAYPLDTGFKSPTSNSEPYGDWKNPENAYASDDVDTIGQNNTDFQDYGTFEFGLSDKSTIDGIEVAVGVGRE
ncbi:MAG: hypothetical protein JXN60_07475 [Lentisphaerae bacterium]|nr:hypothetical protein [Lentisphaerota bacterium]